MHKKFTLGTAIGIVLFNSLNGYGVPLKISSEKQIQISPIVAYINEEIITVGDVQKIVNELKLSQKDALDLLIDQKLLIQDFNHKKGKISNAHLEAQMEAIAQEYFKGNHQTMRHMLHSQGQTFYGLKEDIRKSIIVNGMQQSKLQSPFSISPKRISHYYHEHKEDFQTETRYCIQQSGFKEKDIISINGRLVFKKDYLQQLLQKQVPLADIQKQLDTFISEPIWYQATELDKNILQALLPLSIGQSTPYVRVNEMYIVSKIISKESSQLKPISEIQEILEQALLTELNTQRFKEYIQYLRQQAVIKTFSSNSN